MTDPLNTQKTDFQVRYELIIKLLSTTHEYHSGVSVNLVLIPNANLFDELFLDIFRRWTRQIEAFDEEENRKTIVVTLTKLFKKIQEYHLEFNHVIDESISWELQILTFELAKKIVDKGFQTGKFTKEIIGIIDINRVQESVTDHYLDAILCLGIAYSNRLMGNKDSNLNSALREFELGIRYAEENNYGLSLAATYFNIGTVFKRRQTGDTIKNLELAIDFFKKALNFYRKDSHPREWAGLKMNIGNVYQKILQSEDIFSNETVKLALTSYKEASTVFDRQKWPAEWALNNSNLSGLYYEIITRDNLSEEESHSYYNFLVVSCENCLQIVSENSNPPLWIHTKFRLAQAHHRNNYIDKSFEQIKDLIESKIASKYPKSFLEVVRWLGNLEYRREEYKLASIAYAKAIDAIEKIRSWQFDYSDQKEILSYWNKVFERAINCFFELKDYRKAMEVSQRCKARNLVDHIESSNKLRRRSIPQQDIDLIGELITKILVEERKRFRNPSRDNSQLHKLQKLYSEKLLDIRMKYDSTYAGSTWIPSIQYESFNYILHTRKAALLDFYVSDENIFIFLLCPEWEQPDCIKISGDSFSELAMHISAYFTGYILESPIWDKYQIYMLIQLSKGLGLSKIIEKIPDNLDKLIISPHRELSTIPFNALFVNDFPLPTFPNGKAIIDHIQVIYNQCHIFPKNFVYESNMSLDLMPEEYNTLLDRFINGVSVIPALQCLQIEKSEFQEIKVGSLCAVKNPTDDLVFSSIEVDLVKSLFGGHVNVAESSEANIKRLNSRFTDGYGCLHISCHSYYDYNQPEHSGLILAGGFLNTSDERYLESIKGRKSFLCRKREELSTSIDFENFLSIHHILHTFDLFDCPLVTLSGCETGFIDIFTTYMDYIGLPMAFLSAGARYVVCSLWQVDDFSTSLLMFNFYANLMSSSNLTEIEVSASLRNAQIWLRNLSRDSLKAHLDKNEKLIEKSIDRLSRGKRRIIETSINSSLEREYPFSNPYFWAPFYLVSR